MYLNCPDLEQMNLLASYKKICDHRLPILLFLEMEKQPHTLIYNNLDNIQEVCS